MKITAVRLLQLTGTMLTEGPLWEERLVRPIDIYPEYRTRDDFEGGVQADARHFRLSQHFLRIETDEGPLGIAGPLTEMVAAFAAKRLRPIIVGQDPIAHEKLGTRCTGSWSTAAKGMPCWRSAPSIARCGT
jgi:L-rhamnonate dehydratase